MKILQINKFFYRRGGAESHMLELSLLLQNHGHEVIHFSTLDPKNEASPYSNFFIPSIDLRQIKGLISKIKIFGHILYSTLAAKKLSALIKTTKPDVAHLHNIYHHLSPSILSVLKKNKIPVVMTLHDYKLICPNYKLFTQGAICERCQGGKYWQATKHKCIFDKTGESLAASLEMYFHKFLKIYEKNIDIFISPSQFLKNKFTEFKQKTEKIEVLPNFVYPQSYPNAVLPTNNYLLYFGRFEEQKGLLNLLAAAKQIPEIEIHLVGNGPLASDLFNQITLQQIGNLKVFDKKTGLDLAKEIYNARAIILPAIWYENYPLAILEAMAYGKVVLTSALGGLPEIIKDGETGILFNPFDVNDLVKKVKNLWDNAEKIKEIGTRAKKQIQTTNDPEKYYEELMKIYNKILKKPKVS